MSDLAGEERRRTRWCRLRLRAACLIVLASIGFAAVSMPNTTVSAAAPAPPTNVRTSVYPDDGLIRGQVRLSWDGAGATYDAYYSSNRTQWKTMGPSFAQSDTTATVYGLSDGATYYFRVRACAPFVGTQRECSAYTEVQRTMPQFPPAAPAVSATAAAADGVKPGEVRLSWVAPQDGGAAITDYVIAHSTNGTSWTTVDDGVSTATTYTVAGLTIATQYSFRVKAKTSVADGDWSTTVTATPCRPPSTPRALSATVAPDYGVRSGQVKLTWTAPDGDGGAPITDYVIEQSVDSGQSWAVVNDGVSTATSSTVTGLNGGSGYSFRVSAVNAAGTGLASVITNVTPLATPSVPTAVTATIAGTRYDHLRRGQVKLAWLAPTSDGGAGITDFVVEQSTDGATWTLVDDGVPAEYWDGSRWVTGGQLWVNGLTNAVPYQFRVAAKNVVGAGGWSDPVTVTPIGWASGPGGLTATVAPADGVGSGQVKLAWTIPDDDGGRPIVDYEISYKRSWGQDEWVTVDDPVSTATTAVVGGLANGSEYWFNVAAKTSMGTGEPGWVAATPLGAPSVAPRTLTAVLAPAPGVGSGEVQLAWTAAFDGKAVPSTDYRIEFSADGETWTTVDDGVSADTTSIVGGLSNGTAYWFRVTAGNQFGLGPPGAPVQATPVWLPAAADGVTAMAAPAEGVGSGEIQLTWDAPADNGSAITDYLIEWSTDGDNWTTVDDDLSTDRSYTIGGLSNGTGYEFRIVAVNAVGPGQPSLATTATPVWLPATPGGLTATVAPADGVGSSEVRLTWTPPADNGSLVTDYLIEWSADGDTWTTVDDGVSTATTFMVGGLTKGTGYEFRVAAVNAVGTGKASVPAQAVPVWMPAAPGTLTATVAPATGVGSGQVQLTWTAATDNGLAVTDYVLERSTDGTTWTTIRDGVSANPAATAIGLRNGTRYRFRVAAVNALGQGAWSTTIQAAPKWKPTAPSGLRASSRRSGQVRLSWNAPTSSNGAAITDYMLQRSPNGRTWTTIRDGVSTTRSYTVTRLIIGTSYRFRVAARNTVGQGPWSITARATSRTR